VCSVVYMLLAGDEKDSLTEEGFVEKEGLDGSTSKGDHGKTAVNNFLSFGTLDFFVRFSVKKTKEIPANITGGSLAVVEVEGGKFKASDGSKDLHVTDEANRGNSTEGVSVGELIPGNVPARSEGSVLLRNHTDNSKHADTAVLELSPTSVLKIGLDLRKAHGVKTNITSHRSIKFVGLDQERNRFGHLSIQGDSSGPGGGLHLYNSKDGEKRRDLR